MAKWKDYGYFDNGTVEYEPLGGNGDIMVLEDARLTGRDVSDDIIENVREELQTAERYWNDPEATVEYRGFSGRSYQFRVFGQRSRIIGLSSGAPDSGDDEEEEDPWQ